MQVSCHRARPIKPGWYIHRIGPDLHFVKVWRIAGKIVAHTVAQECPLDLNEMTGDWWRVEIDDAH